jgi:L-malate glycosyltransferase
MDAIRILLLDTGKEWGGGTNSMIELLKRIDRNRFHVTALFFENYAKGSGSDLRSELAKINVPLQLMPPLRQPLWAKIAKEVLRSSFFWSKTLRAQLVFEIDYLWRIKPNAQRISAKIRECRSDLLYLNNQPSSNLEGYLAASDTNVPLVQHARIVSQLNRKEVNITNAHVNRIICVSKGVQDDLVRQGVDPEKCMVVYNGIDIHPVAAPQTQMENFYSADQSSPIVIGTVGQLTPRKSVDHLLDAISRIHREGTQSLNIKIVGEGPQRESLEQQTARLGLTSIVTFTGFLTNPLNVMSDFDIFVLASAAEGFPRVILEAMFLGKPVVATRVAGAEELVQPNVTGFLYEYGDISMLTSHLQRLIADGSLRIKLGDAGRRNVQSQYDIERYVRGVESVLANARVGN